MRAGAVGTPELVVEVAGRPVHVEHRGQVHIQARPGQVLPRAPARGLRRHRGMGHLADLPLRLIRCAGQAADQAALLVGHEQQRVVPQRVLRAGVGPVELGRDRRELSLA